MKYINDDRLRRFVSAVFAKAVKNEAGESYARAEEDAIEALVALQYTRREAERAVMEAMRANTGLDSVEDLIRAVLEQQSPA